MNNGFAKNNRSNNPYSCTTICDAGYISSSHWFANIVINIMIFHQVFITSYTKRGVKWNKF